MAEKKPSGDTRDQEIHELRSAQERMRERFVALGALTQRMAATLNPVTVLQEVVDAACELTGARYGALGTFAADGRIVDFVTHGVTDDERAAIGDLPQGLGLLGWLQKSQRPLRSADLGTHRRSVGFPTGHPPMRTFLGVPMHFEDQPLGNLYLTEKAGGEEFTEEDESLLLLLADHAAMAIHNARLHQRAEEERRRLETLVDTSPTGVLVVDAETQEVVFANAEIQRLLRHPFQTGDTIQDYRSIVTIKRPDGTDADPAELPLTRVISRGERVTAEEQRLVYDEGTSVLVLVNATPVYDDAGAITAGIASMQDISSLEEVERLRNEFLGMVSHELRTPLTAIKGSAAMGLSSRHSLSPDEATELFEIVDQQADRLRDLVDNLLDMTRIEAGALSVAAEPHDLGAVIEEAAAAFLPSAGGHEVLVTGTAGHPMANIDARRIGQVAANLLSNAAKFSPANAAIEVAVTQDGSALTTRVRDQGRGIPSEQIGRLFSKFAQIPDERGRVTPGNGLGLAICKGIVEAHGGRIWAESEGLGLGTTFGFSLPLATTATKVDVTHRSEHMGHVGHAGERTRVLVVDDEPQVLRHVQRALSEAGYNPTATGDPADVVRLVELEEPDLVLLDLNLAGTSGYDLLARIREFSGVPVMFLTANNQPEEAAKALRAGADDYITKPFSTSELIARIEASLRRRVLPDQMEARAPFELNGLSIDYAERLVLVDGAKVSLSATEYKLLYELSTNAGRVLTHDLLLRNVWGAEYSGESELLRSFIRNVRRKLGDDARNPRFIQTESQVGYRVPRAQ